MGTGGHEISLSGTLRRLVAPLLLADEEVLVHGGALPPDDLARGP